jgi:phosphohistidine phosphatase
MKRIYLLRHAKSSWENDALADFDRPLNQHGWDAAPFMGRLMKERGLVPDRVVSSPAVRARQTAESVCENAGFDTQIEFDERIYEASPQGLRQVVAEQENKHDAILLVGHNPGIEGFIRFLTGEVEPMPTAALAVIDLEIDTWQEISADSGTIVALIRPKDELKRSGVAS